MKMMLTSTNCLPAPAVLVQETRLSTPLCALFILTGALLAACGGSNPSNPTTDGPSANPQGYCANARVDLSPPASTVLNDVGGAAANLVKSQSRPGMSDWAPQSLGLRSSSEADFAASDRGVVLPRDRGSTMHGGLRSEDEFDTVLAPAIEHQWTAEPNIFVPEGPIFGDYLVFASGPFSWPGTALDFSMTALDRESGARVWQVVPSQTAQTGALLTLRDTQTSEIIVYGGGGLGIFAVTESGEMRWCSNTGLDFPENPLEGGGIRNHLFGLNYHRPTDSIVGVYSTGDLLAIDRQTGEIIGRGRLNGAPGKPDALNLPQFIIDGAEREFREVFVPDGIEIPEGSSFIQPLIDIILGGAVVVSNFYAADPDSDLLWIAGTLPDEADGTEDGLADFGALNAVRLRKGMGVDQAFDVHCQIRFEGGTASTPALQAGGHRIYTSDTNGNVLAFDQDCDQVWSFNTGSDINASLTVSATDGAIYAPTTDAVVKIEDLGDRAELRWRSNYDKAFVGGELLGPVTRLVGQIRQATGGLVPVGLPIGNLVNVLSAENALFVQGAIGLKLGENPNAFSPIIMATILLDKDTGEVLNATASREESVSVTTADQEGAVYLANSPLRRLFVRGLFRTQNGLLDGLLDAGLAPLLPSVVGGVSKYAPKESFDLLARDASCHAQRRLERWLAEMGLATTSFERSLEAEVARNLLRQARGALAQAVNLGEVSPAESEDISTNLDEAQLALTNAQVARARDEFAATCMALQQ